MDLLDDIVIAERFETISANSFDIIFLVVIILMEEYV